VGTPTTEVNAAAATAEVSTASAAVATVALGEARGRDRKNQCQRCGRTQSSQTFHVQTPFPEANPLKGLQFLGSRRFAHEVQISMARLYPA
jgi:hypothetical protein